MARAGLEGPSGFLERHAGDPDPEPEAAPELSPLERELFEAGVEEALQAKRPDELLARLSERQDELDERLARVERRMADLGAAVQALSRR